MTIVPSAWLVGSIWRRWNPHIHAPGTLRNDQFQDDWEGYLSAIENASPTVQALGITDYASIECYKKVVHHHAFGRMPSVNLIFPNIEFRFAVETKDRGINLHLLFCPDDSDHVERIEHALTALTFEYRQQPFHCTPADLMRLGRTHNPNLTDDESARSEGANQFKIEMSNLKQLFRQNKWVANNCLVGVAAKSTDGTASLQADAAFAAMRQDIESFSHVIINSNPKTREFWLTATPEFRKSHGGPKPVLHGCDAHSVKKTCLPDENRYCWIRGNPTFDSLRQTLLEPDQRVWLGESPPDGHDLSHCISSIQPINTGWINSPQIPLNNGLVAIIGARGSGKTALADILAIGADVLSPLDLASSFIHRASRPDNHLTDSKVRLRWGDGSEVTRELAPRFPDQEPEAIRYLSQQFVEQLCSAEGVANELRTEIERVVFAETDSETRLNAQDFPELADIHLDPIRRRRDLLKETIQSTSTQITLEEALQRRVPELQKEREQRSKAIDRNKRSMSNLIPPGGHERAKRLEELTTAVTAASTNVEKLNRAKLSLQQLQTEVETLSKTKLPEMLQELKDAFEETGLSTQQWEIFRLRFSGNIPATIAARRDELEKQISTLNNGTGTPLAPEDPLSNWPLKKLIEERDKTRIAVGIDATKQKLFTQLQTALTNDEKLQSSSEAELKHALGATERRQAHIESRRKLYVQVFQTYLDEQKDLENLYAPLQNNLKEATGTLKRLRLSVSRELDLNKWVEAGEDLLDLRKESKLRGRGTLLKEAETKLLPAWRTGTAEKVGESMHSFIEEFRDDLLKSMPSTVEQDDVSEWKQKIATWLYSTDHVEMRYGITYDNVAIEQLSPGTRGIVLLLLYLVIDKHDQRPLVIDQPEENLDPKSVFEELVPHFRLARQRRQVVIVTHNANLVVNTDADQVIVASSTPNPTGEGLPTIDYQCGALEDPDIRKSVCEILEGGEEAFQERERRYRLGRQH